MRINLMAVNSRNHLINVDHENRDTIQRVKHLIERNKLLIIRLSAVYNTKAIPSCTVYKQPVKYAII